MDNAGKKWPNMPCCYIVTSFRSDHILVMACWFAYFWLNFESFKRVKFVVFWVFCGEHREGLEICHADISRSPPKPIIFWSRPLGSKFWRNLTCETGQIYGFPALGGECMTRMICNLEC